MSSEDKQLEIIRRRVQEALTKSDQQKLSSQKSSPQKSSPQKSSQSQFDEVQNFLRSNNEQMHHGDINPKKTPESCLKAAYDDMHFLGIVNKNPFESTYGKNIGNPFEQQYVIDYKIRLEKFKKNQLHDHRYIDRAYANLQLYQTLTDKRKIPSLRTPGQSTTSLGAPPPGQSSRAPGQPGRGPNQQKNNQGGRQSHISGPQQSRGPSR